MCATKLLEVQEPHYLHCDNPDCSHDLPFDGPYDQHLVGTICPKCGADMLTQEDYDDSVLVMSEIEGCAKMLEGLSKEEISAMMEDIEIPEGMDPEAMMEMSFHVHNGEINTKMKIVEKK